MVRTRAYQQSLAVRPQHLDLRVNDVTDTRLLGVIHTVVQEPEHLMVRGPALGAGHSTALEIPQDQRRLRLPPINAARDALIAGVTTGTTAAAVFKAIAWLFFPAAGGWALLSGSLFGAQAAADQYDHSHQAAVERDQIEARLNAILAAPIPARHPR